VIIEVFVFLGVLSLLYFLPTFVALVRQHRHHVAIAFLNLFTGWTLIGWVAALVWAIRSDVAAWATANAQPLRQEKLTLGI